jgi:phosphoglycolate phosphatase
MRDGKTINECLDEFLEVYGKRSEIETEPYPGIAEMLDKLTHLDLKLAILSNKPHALTRQCMDHFFLRWKFDVILGQQENISPKPDPAGALLIAEKTGLSASSFLYVGDSGVDMKTAVSAGMYPAGALWGFRTEKELKDSGAESLLNHPLDVLGLVG